MGVDAGDFDGNGTDDIFVTHLMDETNTLYVNLGESLFEDRTREAGRGAGPSFHGFRNVLLRLRQRWLARSVCRQRRGPTVTVSCARNIRSRWANRINSFAIRAREVLLKSGRGRRGASFWKSAAARRSATSITTAIQTCRHEQQWAGAIAAEQIGNRNHFGIAVVGKNGRDMLGAYVEVTTANGAVLRRRARTDGSYLCANDPRVLVGLGASAKSNRCVCVGLTVRLRNGKALRSIDTRP